VLGATAVLTAPFPDAYIITNGYTSNDGGMSKPPFWVVTVNEGLTNGECYFTTRQQARAYMDEWKLLYVENCPYFSYEDGDDLCSRCEARFTAQADTGLVEGNGVYLRVQPEYFTCPLAWRRHSI
jgi:hypothetical protein